MAAKKGNSYAKGNKGGGRPTEYMKEYSDDAFNYALLGATDKQLSEFFGVSEQTINTWKKEHNDFSLALKKGKSIADGKIAKSLYEKAISGDTTAMIFWLKNRRKAYWRDKQDHEVTGPDGGAIVTIIRGDDAKL